MFIPAISKSLFSRRTHDRFVEHRKEQIPSIKYASFCHQQQENSFSSLTRTNNMSFLAHPSSYDQRICDPGNKYLIQLKTDDYQENEFQLSIDENKYHLIIDGKHHEEDHLGGFIRREIHKIFPIPRHIDLKKHVHTYNPHTQELTIEMPYLSKETSISQSNPSSLTFSYANLNLTPVEPLLPSTNKSFDSNPFHPQIVSSENNDEKLLMSLDLQDYQPEDIRISIKDHELIVQAERKNQNDTRKSRQTFYQSTTLPPQADVERLQSNYLEGKLLIEVPYFNRRQTTNNE